MSNTQNTNIELSISEKLLSALESAAKDKLHSLCDEIILRLEHSILPAKNSRLHSQAELFEMATEVARMTGGKEKSKQALAARKKIRIENKGSRE